MIRSEHAILDMYHTSDGTHVCSISAGSLVFIFLCVTCFKNVQAATVAKAATAQCSSLYVPSNYYFSSLVISLLHSCPIPVYVEICNANDIFLQAAEVQQEAALLLGRLSLSEACKGAIRGHFGIVTLLKMLDRPGLDRSLKEVVVRTLSILAVDNEVNQDHIRCAVAEALHCLFMLSCI